MLQPITMIQPHLRLRTATLALLLGTLLSGWEAPCAAVTNDPIAQIRDEGLNRSKVMEIVRHITEVNGPRLTGSPEHKKAAEWARDEMKKWGLEHAALEPWGPFGRGWTLKRFSAQVVEPYTFPLIACPNAWSPGLKQPILADVVFLDIGSTNDLENLKGQFAGKIVLVSSLRELKPKFDPIITRYNETNLLKMANAAPSSSSRSPRSDIQNRTNTNSASSLVRISSPTNQIAGATTNRSRFGGPGPGSEMGRRARTLAFLQEESAALVVFSSSLGDGGALFAAAAYMPQLPGASFADMPRAWHTNAPLRIPQITLATEDYNRLFRLVQDKVPVKMAVDLSVAFNDKDLMSYNTVAEIPGSDLKQEVVMLGGHLDSWHAGTGATDDAIGVAVAMEAARLIKVLDLHPRRTIRVGLWSGEEQGLLGSKAYVSRHFGYYTNTSSVKSTAKGSLETPRESSSNRRGRSTGNDPDRKLITTRDYKQFCAYFNVDNGTGQLRGIYLQGNEAMRPTFRQWLEPFRDLGAETISASNTGGTDHLSFDAIGLPGFQFIQDPLDYFTRTHHSNQDTLDRIIPEDAKQISVILAAMVYDAAMADAKVARKPKE